MQHDVTKTDAFAIGVAIDGNGTRQIKLHTGAGDLFQLAARHYFSDKHRGCLERFNFILPVCSAGLVLDHKNAKSATGAQNRHAEEGMINFLTGFRKIAESRMRLRIGKIERLGRSGNRADKTLPHFQLCEMHGILVETFGGVKFQHAVGAQHVDRANLRHHVAGNLTDDLVQTVLRFKVLRHHFAQPLEQDARTCGKVSHRVCSPTLPIRMS
ncbi:hypothetical protein D3C71_659550 [compost metagenome]